MARKIKYAKRSKEVLTADFPGTKVIFNTATRRSYILNETASAVWDFCKRPKEIAGIVKFLRETYGVSAARAERDVKRFAAGMKKRKVMIFYERRAKV